MEDEPNRRLGDEENVGLLLTQLVLEEVEATAIVDSIKEFEELFYIFYVVVEKQKEREESGGGYGGGGEDINSRGTVTP